MRVKKNNNCKRTLEKDRMISFENKNTYNESFWPILGYLIE